MGILTQPLIAVIVMAFTGIPGLLLVALGWRNKWLVVFGIIFLGVAAWLGYNAFLGSGYNMPAGMDAWNTPQPVTAPNRQL